jgi:hypothetical protein
MTLLLFAKKLVKWNFRQTDAVLRRRLVIAHSERVQDTKVTGRTSALFNDQNLDPRRDSFFVLFSNFTDRF